MSVGRLKKYGLRIMLPFLIAVSLAAVTTTYAARYVVSQLLSPTPQTATARGINNSGKATGFATYGTYSASATTRAFVFSNNSSALLNGPAGTSYGTAINESGQVAGYGPVGAYQHAILWSSGVPQDLGVLAGTTSSNAYGVNDLGAVVGNSGAYPFIWQDGVMSRLGTATGYAYGINSSGQVAGSGNGVPVIWDSIGNMTNLTTGSGTAYRVNEAGQVVGYYYNNGYKGFLWQGGSLQALATPAGASSTYAYSINDPGLVVGYGYFTLAPYNRALLWDSSSVSDLNTLIPAGCGWILTKAWDINATGQIVGEGTFNGKTQAFLLTPTPNPVTQAAVSGTAGCGGWYTSAVAVTLTATDNSGSGIKEIRYSLDGAQEIVIGDTTAAVLVSGHAAHNLSYYAVDYAGNVEASNTLAVNIDGATPSSVTSVAGTVGANGWYKSPVTVQINGSDTTSGVGSIKYRKNIGGIWGSTITAGNPASVSFGNFSSGGSNGRFSVGHSAVDRACNTETEKFIDVNIDSAPPITTYTTSSAPSANGWYNTDVTVSFSGADNLSGVDFLTINGANVPGAIFSSIIGEGTATFTYSATDRAGIAEGPKSASFRVDKTLPAVSVSTSPATLAASSKTKLVPVTINGSAGDALSGLASVLITITDEYGSYNMTVPAFGATVNLDTYKKRNDADGRLYTVKATATDFAGNQQTSVYNLWVK